MQLLLASYRRTILEKRNEAGSRQQFNWCRRHYVFCYYNAHVAGINAVVWGLLAGAVLYFAVGKATCKNGLDPDIIKNCF